MTLEAMQSITVLILGVTHILLLIAFTRLRSHVRYLNKLYVTVEADSTQAIASMAQILHSIDAHAQADPPEPVPLEEIQAATVGLRAIMKELQHDGKEFVEPDEPGHPHA